MQPVLSRPLTRRSMLSVSQMRKYYYKPRAQEDLADLDALDDLEMINNAVKDLAADRKKGYVIPLQGLLLRPQQVLLQYQVGRYKLNYTLTKIELNVESVLA